MLATRMKQAASALAAAFTYLLQDEFTTPDAAPVASPRTCEPGPGTITFTDTGNRLSISGGQLVIGSDTTAYLAIGTAQTRAAGLAFFFKASVSTGSGSFGGRYGWSGGGGASGSKYWFYNTFPGSFVTLAATFFIPSLINITTEPQYWWVVTLANGSIFGMSTGGLHRILFIERLTTAASPQPMAMNHNSTAFSAITSSWRVGQLGGGWATDTGLTVVNVASPADGETATGLADHITEFTWTPASSEVLNLMVRRTDDNNTWIIRADQAAGNIKLFEKSGGVETQRGSTGSFTWSVGVAWRIMVIQDDVHSKVLVNRVSNNFNFNVYITYGSSTFNKTVTGVKVSGFATGANLRVTPRFVSFPNPKPFTDDIPFLAYGDSKTLGGTWEATLETALETASGREWSTWQIARGGHTVAQMQALIDADLLGLHQNPAHILCNLGANDSSPLPVEATWKANYLYIADAMHTKWPNALIYIAKAWVQGRDAACDTLATWTDDIVASRAFLRAGHDERVWLEGGDNGATMTSDGVHYSVAGSAECAAQWQDILGY